MKFVGIVVIGIAFSFAAMAANAQTYVQGYYKSNGTYVAPHYQSSPNQTVRDNYSYKGNANPYTGTTGSSSYRSSPTSEYYQGYSTPRSNSRSSMPSNPYSTTTTRRTRSATCAYSAYGC